MLYNLCFLQVLKSMPFYMNWMKLTLIFNLQLSLEKISKKCADYVKSANFYNTQHEFREFRAIRG